jgi:hypothetical protein
MADKLAEYSTAIGAGATPAPTGGMESPLFNSPTGRTRALASRNRVQRGSVNSTFRRGGHPDPETKAKVASLEASQARLEARLEAALFEQQSQFASRFDRLEQWLKQTNKQRILVNFSISKNSMALGTRPLERVPNNVS